MTHFVPITPAALYLACVSCVGCATGVDSARTDSHTDASVERPDDANRDGNLSDVPNGPDALDARDTGEAPDGWIDDARDIPTVFEVFGDPDFLDGFWTYPSMPTSTPTGELVPPTATSDPTWSLMEWHSNRLLPTDPPERVDLGWQWANAYKRVVVDEGVIELAINAENEYGGEYRDEGEDWPLLVVSQNIYDTNELTRSTPIHEYRHLTLRLNVELVYAHHIRDPDDGYSAARHACQFFMFFTLQNRDRSHPDHGNLIWLGLPLYDDREAFVEEAMVFESGVGKHIFRMAGRDFMSESLHDVPIVDIEIDLAETMQGAIVRAVELGILGSTDLDDYYLGEMNLGFEVPGRSIATVRVRNLRMTAERAP